MKNDLEKTKDYLLDYIEKLKETEVMLKSIEDMPDSIDKLKALIDVLTQGKI